MPVYLPPISRRRFIAGSFAAATALALGPGCASTSTPKKPRAANTLVLISDTHIASDPDTVSRDVNMTDHFKTVSGEIMAWPESPDAVLINGDLAFNSGEPEDYAAVLRLLHPLREAGMPIHLNLGNHDHRQHFWAAMPDSRSVPPHLPDRQAALVRTPTANWFMLDSLIRTLVTPGMLGDQQRAWLASALDANPDKPAIIMVHHQPGPLAPGKPPGNGLEDADLLFNVIRPRRQVKAWFFGHTHRWSVRQDESGIALINLPPTAYVFEAGQPSGWVHATMFDNGMRLELRCVDLSHPAQGQIAKLTWRTG